MTVQKIKTNREKVSPKRRSDPLPLIMVTYSFESALNLDDENRYVNEINGTVHTTESGPPIEVIGKFHLYRVLVDGAMEGHYNLRDAFDITQSLFSVGENIFNFDHGEYQEYINDFYRGEIFNYDLLVIDRIEILPKYRGCGIGERLIKEIYVQFSHSVGLIVLKPFPLQFENEGKVQGTEWDKLMEYKHFKKSEKQAFIRLKKFYLSLGFETISSNEYLFMNTALKNSKLNKIKFDE